MKRGGASPIRRWFWRCRAAGWERLRRHIGIFGLALERLVDRAGSIELVIPTVPHLASQVREATAGWTVAARVVVEPADKWAAFRKARAALAASGTVTLELALSGVPTVAAYRLSGIEAAIARLIRLQARLPSFILANLVLGENVMPELLQEDCAPQKLADALVPLLSDTPQRRRQVAAFRRLDDIMAIGGAQPSAKAAAIAAEAARRGRRSAAASGDGRHRVNRASRRRSTIAVSILLSPQHV